MIPGDGQYHVQPIFAGDLARLAVEKSGEQSSVAIDAVGPETFTFNELVDLLRRIVGSRARILHVSPTAVLLFARLFSVATRDITLTSDEIGGLMADLLVSRGSPTGPTRLTEWLAQNAGEMGSCYSSELARRT
jgi:NADH dehydrogenase